VPYLDRVVMAALRMTDNKGGMTGPYPPNFLGPVIEDTLMFGGTLLVPARTESDSERPDPRWPGDDIDETVSPFARDEDADDLDEEEEDDDDGLGDEEEDFDDDDLDDDDLDDLDDEDFEDEDFDDEDFDDDDEFDDDEFDDDEDEDEDEDDGKDGEP
jgi:hypothetical protein